MFQFIDTSERKKGVKEKERKEKKNAFHSENLRMAAETNSGMF